MYTIPLSTTSTTPTLNQIQRQDLDTDNHNDLLEKACSNTMVTSKTTMEINKFSRSKEEENIKTMTTTGSPGYRETEFDKIKYKKYKHIGTDTTTPLVGNIQSHKEQLRDLIIISTV